jgi:hypothetical protein
MILKNINHKKQEPADIQQALVFLPGEVCID